MRRPEILGKLGEGRRRYLLAPGDPHRRPARQSRKIEALREWFEAFHGELRVSINESIDRAGAVDMMAQHILTRAGIRSPV